MIGKSLKTSRIQARMNGAEFIMLVFRCFCLFLAECLFYGDGPHRECSSLGSLRPVPVFGFIIRLWSEDYFSWKTR